MSVMKILNEDEKKMLEGIDKEKFDDDQLEMVTGGFTSVTNKDPTRKLLDEDEKKNGKPTGWRREPNKESDGNKGKKA